VNLSIHTAPASHTLEISRLQSDAESNPAPPSFWLAESFFELTHPLRSISITENLSLLRDDPPLCPRIGTLTLMGLPLEFLPFHQGDRFPCSVQEPKSDSRHLYAGPHPDSKQVSSELILV